MNTKFASFIHAFANRRGLKRKIGLEPRDDKGRPGLYCDEPAIVARFSSELRQIVRRQLGPSTRLLLRGQTTNHPGMVPGLFRPPNNTVPIATLIAAEEDFAKDIRQSISVGRFKRPSIAALLQHYGYRTTWLDVVDNLWTAVWFATHEISSADGAVCAHCLNRTGWLYFMAVPDDQATDLRESHHGLSLRPHAQAGWSVRGVDASIADLNEFVVASVEFSVNDRWKLDGHMASDSFFLPGANLDDTLARVRRYDIDHIASLVEARHRLASETLGRSFPTQNIA